MEQRSGGHYLDTGDGPIPLDPPVTETPPTRQEAWNAYQAHLRSCSQCPNAVWRCAEGDELWNAYITF